MPRHLGHIYQVLTSFAAVLPPTNRGVVYYLLVVLLELSHHLFRVGWLIAHPITQLIVMHDSLLELPIQHRILKVIPDLPAAALSRAVNGKLVHIFPEVLHNRCLFLIFNTSAG